MSAASVRNCLEAYSRGALSEAQLREAIRTAARSEPQLAAAFGSLVSAHEQMGRIGRELAAAIRADLASLDIPAAPAAAQTSPTQGNTTGSSWDTPERLAEPSVSLSVGSILGRRFELLDELGRGGMGVVYRALDQVTAALRDRDPHVAIKLLNDEFKRHPLAVRSLQREARKAQKLAHPNVIKVYDFDRDGGNVYMVMELLKGHSLSDALQREPGGHFATAEALRIVRALGAGLSYAHEHGIVHADFKPGNAFITETGEVKILDFGVARAAQSLNAPGEKTLFDAGQLGAISPPYASPEMLMGGEPDPRDDIYALGCVAYELLTGEHPFKRIDALKARDAGLQPEPVRGLRREQWRALRSALAFEREARTRDVATLIAGLCDAPPPRRWWPAVAAGVVILAAAGWGLSRLWATHQEQSLALDLRSSDDAVYQRALAGLRSTASATRSRLLADDQVRQSLVRRYSVAITAALSGAHPDRPRAARLVAELQQLLPDSRAVADLAKSVAAGAAATPVIAAAAAPTVTAAPASSAAPVQPPPAPPPTTGSGAAPAIAAVPKTSPAPPPAPVVMPVAPASPPAPSSAPAAARPAAPAQSDPNGELKQTLVQQIQGGDMDAAMNTANLLRRHLGGGAYVNTELPRMLVAGFVQLATRQMQSGQVNESLQTLANARRKFGTNPDLKSLEARYVVVGDVYDRLSSAVVLNVGAQQQYLEQLRAAEGGDYPAIEAMLARTLADRIADQKAANHPSVVAALLEAGRKVFPEHAAMLEQGKAGELPKTGLEVAD